MLAGYQQGIFDMTDLLAAQQEILLAKRNVIDLQYALHLQLLELERLTGLPMVVNGPEALTQAAQLFPISPSTTGAFSMNFFRFISILVLAISLSFTTTVSAHGDEHDEEAEHQHEEPAKGPHGGRLLTQDDVALEVTIYETEVEPELRVYLYQNGEPIKTSELKLQVTLQRLGEAAELVNFNPELDYWLGDTVIREPHSFEVEISASYQGKNFEWHYDSFEGRTELSARSVEKAGIELQQTQPGQIHTQLHLFGVVAPVPEQQYQVGAAYAGVVQQLAVKVGDKVTKGQLLATVQNPVSLKKLQCFCASSR